jgi:hypothetical protein
MLILKGDLRALQSPPEERERARVFFNVIADRVENISPWQAKRILANHKNGAVLAYSSTWKLP